MDYHYKWSNMQVTKAASVFYLTSKIIMASTIITKKGETAHFEAYINVYIYRKAKKKSNKKLYSKWILKI